MHTNPGADDADIGRLRTYVGTTYSPVSKDEQERLIDGLAGLIDLGFDRRQTVNSILEQVTKIIFKFFDFREIAIGLKSRVDGLYRYEVTFGYSKEKQEDFKKLAYTLGDMLEYNKFPNFQMCRISSFNFVEGLPDQEKHLFALPQELKTKRFSVDTFHEGDYIDTWINGPGKELIGWIEMSSPLSKKLPPRIDMKWIELIADICGVIISYKWRLEGAPQK